MEPIIEFKTIKEATDCLKEWQTRLFLDDWIIKIKLCRPDEFIGEDRCGENEYQVTNKSSVIRILKQKFYGDRIVKFCHEETLIHELLHLKYGMVCPVDPVSYAEAHLRAHEHMLVEQMAKSLIMAKYNLPFEWFKNF